jgi:hypothetical protein
VIAVIPDGTGFWEAMREFERQLLAAALHEHGSASAAARALGLRRTQLHDKMRPHGLHSPLQSRFARRGLVLLEQQVQHHEEGDRSSKHHG